MSEDESKPKGSGYCEVTRCRDVARKWEHLQRRIHPVGFVIREWDFLGPAVTATVEE